MPRNVTITFDDGSTHSYQNVPDTVTPDQVEQRALTEFNGKKVVSLAGSSSPSMGFDPNAVEPHSGKTYGQLRSELDAYQQANNIRNTTPEQHAQEVKVAQDQTNFVKQMSPTVGMSDTDKFLSGAGKAYSDIGTGIHQLYARAADFLDPQGRVQNLQSQVAETRRLDSPLLQTKSGIAGNVVGNAAVTAPATLIPGANTITGAAIIGGSNGLLQPSESAKETLVNTGLGAATGAASQYASNKIGNFVSNKLAQRSANAATDESLNSARDAVLNAAQKEGYVVPPTAVNPTATNTALESISGKSATRQVAQAKNQAVTNRLIATDSNLRQFGMDASKPITQEALANVRSNAGTVYGAVKKIGNFAPDQTFKNELQTIAQSGSDLESMYPGIGAQASEKVQQLINSVDQASHSGESIVELSKLLRQRAADNFKAGFAGDADALQLAKAQQGVANAAEDLVYRHLVDSGQQALSQRWDQARTAIAKSYQAQAALEGGKVDATYLASQLQKGKPLTGNFKLVADFADQFPDVAKVPKSGAGVSNLGAMVWGGGAMDAAALGHPKVAAGMAAAAGTRYGTRQAILSPMGQNMLARPNYAPSALGTFGLNSLTYPRYAALPALNTLLASQSGE